MGIGITGISKAKRVPCSGEPSEDDEYDVCADEHITVDVPSRGRDRVKMGCYVPGPGGRMASLDFNYFAYDGWIRRLSLMALGVEPEDVWNYPRRYRGKPFVELIRFQDTECGVIGPITSAKLYDDFVAFAARAKRYFATSTPNVFSLPQVEPEPSKGKPHRNRIGLSNVVELVKALDGTEPEWDEGKNLDWMWESYQQFRRAFRLAKDAGFVVFY
ncbi:MAG: hypothetical protein ACLQGP_39700 [Isosphaeraceae bacterium]